MKFLKIFTLIMCLVMVLFAVTSCGKETRDNAVVISDAQSVTIGEGNTQFTFTVTDYDGKVSVYAVNTDKETVGEALVENSLIDGEDGPYGLYVKTVNNIRADYEKDGKYWAFYVDGEYALAGVDTTPIDPAKVYSFKVE